MAHPPSHRVGAVDYTGYSNAVDANQQTYTEGYQVSFDISIGAKKKDSFHVDLVVNVVMTDEVEIAEPVNALELPKLPSNPYRLSPVVDQIADKVCATLALSTTAARRAARSRQLSRRSSSELRANSRTVKSPRVG